MELDWLPPKPEDWSARLRAIAVAPDPAARWAECVALSRYRIDFLDTAKLDREMQRLRERGLLQPDAARSSLRLALLASSTVQHLVPGLRVGAVRHGIELVVHEGDYGQYRQELMDADSSLRAFRPDAVLLALDSYHLAESGSAESSLQILRDCWRQIHGMGATAIQQTLLPVHARLMGNNEHAMADSPAAVVEAVNAALRQEPEVMLLAVDAAAAADGTTQWHDPVLWHRAKQEIHPRVSHIYGELAGRLIGAVRGRSRKCLVLDLDNTLWGGVIGDDGLDGIQLGQGTAIGEAYVAFQRYAQRLARRGIILAVCSKNDKANATEPFAKHPDMLLKSSDIACFVANWQDKASNLRSIAKRLNIGLDALVFADDNPFERNLVRQELPEVAVPELPEDPAFYAQTIANAGYFEALTVTKEDEERGDQYQANLAREELRAGTIDLEGYLRGLEMELIVRRFDEVGVARITQLINKTNQFNLTTRRYTEEDVRAMVSDEDVIALQFRLLDRFGDNGTIAVLIGRREGDAVDLDTWLMSCRVLGRGLEQACLNAIGAAARAAGAGRLTGQYRPTAKNAMVSELYARLGFTLVPASAADAANDGITRWELLLDNWQLAPALMRVTDDKPGSERSHGKIEKGTEKRTGWTRQRSIHD
jgi:FkbH-like protein